jgi:FkbM family methyltransferase
MKKLLKKLLKKLNILHKFQYLQLYRVIRNPAYKKHYKLQYSFYKSLLKSSNYLIFDIGANAGDYTYIFKKLSRKVISVDPDPKNITILKSRFSNSKVTIIQKAVSNEIGFADYFMVEGGSGYNTLSNKWVNVLENEELTRFKVSEKFVRKAAVETITLRQLISEFGMPDFIKVDVEGFELNVVKGLKIPVPLISVECNFPEFREETIQLIDYVRFLDNDAKFNYANEYEFYLTEFVKSEEILDILEKTPYRYFELYCKMNTSK